MTALSERRWVWVTRAEPGASETGGRLVALGYEAIIGPMIETAPRPAEAPPRSTYDALAFTSATAVRRFAELSDGRDAPVFAVGAATATVARAIGWRDVVSANSDVKGLGALLAREAKGLRVLHPCAEAPAGDLAAYATDVAVNALPVYVTVPATVWPERVVTLLDKTDGAVLIHSPSAARALAALPRIEALARRLTAFALSDACMAPIVALSLREIVVAPFPKETALLKVMSETLRP